MEDNVRRFQKCRGRFGSLTQKIFMETDVITRLKVGD